MQALQQAASLLRAGQHQRANELLEDVQRIPSPAIVEIGTELLQQDLGTESLHTHFYAARVVRCAVIRDWNSHWKLHADSTLQFALNYLGSRAAALAESPCRALLSEICALWSVTWKLRCADATMEGRDAPVIEALVASVLQLLQSASSSAPEAHRVVLRNLLINAIEEFGLYHASSHGRVLPIAAHESCRRAFKNGVLAHIVHRAFCWGLDPLQESARSASALVQLWYSALCWNFSDSSISTEASTTDRIPEVLCCEGETWQQLFACGVTETGFQTGSVDSAAAAHAVVPVPMIVILNNWFTVALPSPETASSIVQCMLQLSGLTATDWPLDARITHFERTAHILFQCCAKSLSMGLPGVSLVHGLCASLHRLVASIGCAECVFRCPSVVEQFVNPLLSLTRTLVDLLHDPSIGAQEEVVESVDFLLRLWLEMVHKGFGDVSVTAMIDELPVGKALSESSATVLRSFVDARTHRLATVGEAALLSDEPDSCHDREYEESHTQLLALLGRSQPASTATFLIQALNPLIQNSAQCLSRRQSTTTAVNESLWFLLTISAQFLSDGSESERNAIPNTIVSLALHWERQFPDDNDQQETHNEVFQLIRLVLQFAQQLQPNLATSLVSPGVCEAILQVLRHVSLAYVFPDDLMQLDGSNAIATCFGGGVGVADVAMHFAAACYAAFPHEGEVTARCASLLAAFTDKPPAFGEWFVRHETFSFFVQLVCDSVGYTKLSGKDKGKILSALVSACPTDSVHATVVAPVGSALSAVIQRAASTPQGQLLDVGNAVSSIESLGGAFAALRNEAQTRLVFGALAPLVDSSVAAMQAHAAFKPLLVATLTMLSTIVESCSFLASSSFIHVVELGVICVRVTKTTMEDSKRSAVHLSPEAASQEEDERLEVLESAAMFVEFVATWGLMDLNSDDDGGAPRGDAIAELSVQGLLVVLSFCDQNNLAVPQLRDRVFSLLQVVSSTFTSKFLSVSDAEASSLLAATDYALRSSTPALNRSGLKVMESIAAHCAAHGVTQLSSVLSSFLESVSRSMSSGQLDSSVYPALGSALFALFGACGVELGLQTVFRVFSEQPLLAGPFESMRALAQRTNFSSRGREVKAQFVRGMEGILLAVKGARIV